jgi:hypothetical protein
MIEELDSYALSDFLLFSQETYFRLFELYNRDLWPVHLAALALGLALLWLMRRPDERSGRAAAAILVVMWAWVGWAFHLERYATINLAAPYFAALFGIEALLLTWSGVIRGKLRFAESDSIAAQGRSIAAQGRSIAAQARSIAAHGRSIAAQAGFVIVAFSVLINPLIGILAGREWSQVSLFGLGPDPTAMATIGALLAVRGKSRWLPIAFALAWCVVATLTAIAMGSIEGFGPGMVVVVTIAIAFRESIASR